jgi:hypothetical protein
MIPLAKIVAVALILLVTVAFVVIYILRTGTGQLMAFSEAQGMCGAAGASSCQSAGDLPFSWITEMMGTEQGSVSCADVMGCVTCESCGFWAG